MLSENWGVLYIIISKSGFYAEKTEPMKQFDQFATETISLWDEELKSFEKKVTAFFNDTSFFTQLFKKKNAEINKMLSNDFNVFRYININENAFSDIISDILNPYGEHGQSDTFLNVFIKMLKIDSRKISTLPVVKREVLTKQYFKTRCRMDLLIDWSDFGIMIENKPKCGDEPEQLQKYIKDLTNKYSGERSFIVIFLSNEGRKPSDNSLPEKLKEELTSTKQYYHFTYQNEFSRWLKECINLCQSEKYRWFLRDFHFYIC